MRSSVIFPVGTFGLRSASHFKSICLWAFVPNLAKSDFLTITSFRPGCLIIEVCSFDFMTDEPGAKTSYSPSRVFFDLLDLCFFFASFNVREVFVLGTSRPTSGWEIIRILCFDPHYIVFLPSYWVDLYFFQFRCPCVPRCPTVRLVWAHPSVQSPCLNIYSKLVYMLEY